MSPGDQITLEHVRLRGARVDAAVARLRVSHLLATAVLRPPAMSPSAVLVVRAMADPLPGRIAGELSAAATASAEWEHAAQDCLGALYARAARPAWGPVSSTADAVLFADYAELLACLARDLSYGAAGGWWWRSLLKRYSLRLPGSWAGFWEEHPQYVPSALQQLNARGHAVAVLERIAPVQAWRLLVQVARAFDLPGSAIPQSEPVGLGRSVAGQPPQDAGRRTDSSHEPTRIGRGDPEAGTSESIIPVRLPWEPYVPSSATPAALGLERRALLGVGLLLWRAPAVALTSGFSLRFHDWLTLAEGPESRPNDAAAADPFIAPRSSRNTAVPALMTSRVSPQATGPGPPPVESPAASRMEPLGSLQSELRNEPRNGPRIHARAAARPELRPDWESGAVTRLGGILYLIHLVRQMELVRHFETGLSGWALVELMARCLVDLAEAVTMDPIWDVLAELDDRDPRTAPGEGFEARSTYTAPNSWWQDLDEEPRLVRYRSRGIEVWRPEGFLILDSEDPRIASADFLTGIRFEPRRFRAAAAVRLRGIPVSRELRRFLHFVLPYARWRLGQVLHAIRLEEVLLRKGKLVVSSSHVDLVMSMNQISVPVRLAGLDANPGWVPELGRVVTFHFMAEGFGGSH